MCGSTSPNGSSATPPPSSQGSSNPLTKLAQSLERARIDRTVRAMRVSEHGARELLRGRVLLGGGWYWTRTKPHSDAP